jgi:hypothetical protein
MFRPEEGEWSEMHYDRFHEFNFQTNTLFYVDQKKN